MEKKKQIEMEKQLETKKQIDKGNGRETELGDREGKVEVKEKGR